MPFEPGNVEHAKADRRKPKVITQQLISALNETAAAGNITKLRAVVDTLIGNAIGGDQAAINCILERVDGKVAQPVAGDEDNPLRLLISRIELVPGVRNPG